MELTLENTLLGHQNPIYTIAYDPDRQVLFSAGADKGVVEWNFDTLNFNRVLCAVPTSVYSLYMIPETGLLAIGMRTGEIYIVETASQSLKARLKTDKGAVFSIQALLHKRELIAIGEEGKAYVWNLDKFELLYSFKISDTTVRTIATDPSERHLAFGDKDGVISLYAAEDYSKLAHQAIHDKSVTSLCFFDNALLSGGRDAKMNKLSLDGLQVLEIITPHMFTVYDIAALSDHPYFSTVSRDKTIKIWDKDFRLIKNISRDRGIDSHFLSINTQTYNTQLKRLATAGDDKSIKIWKVEE